MLLEIFIVIGVICWTLSAIVMAAPFGAMFSPDKPKMVSRIVISSLLLVPSMLLIPLSFVAFILLSIIFLVLGLTIFGIRITIELLRDGIPEMDDDGNIIEEVQVSSTAPWV